jgi:hypothetical protein
VPVEFPSARGAEPGDPDVLAGSSWHRSPRFWLAAAAAGSLVLGIAFGVGAILVEPIRLGFGISAAAFVVAAVGVGWSAAAGKGT